MFFLSKEEWENKCDHLQTNEARYLNNDSFFFFFFLWTAGKFVAAALTMEEDPGYETYGLSPTSGIIPLNTDSNGD
jgi:hypothetical protein